MPSSPWREEEGGTFVGGLVIVQRYMCVRLSVCVCMCVRGAHMSKDACLFRRICQWNCVCVWCCVLDSLSLPLSVPPTLCPSLSYTCLPSVSLPFTYSLPL